MAKSEWTECGALWTQNEIGKQKEEKGREEKRSPREENLDEPISIVVRCARRERGSEMAIFWPTSIGKEKREEGKKEGRKGAMAVFYFGLLSFFLPSPLPQCRFCSDHVLQRRQRRRLRKRQRLPWDYCCGHLMPIFSLPGIAIHGHWTLPGRGNHFTISLHFHLLSKVPANLNSSFSLTGVVPATFGFGGDKAKDLLFEAGEIDRPTQPSIRSAARIRHV